MTETDVKKVCQEEMRTLPEPVQKELGAQVSTQHRGEEMDLDILSTGFGLKWSQA